MIKDSGDRREFESGAVRDMGENGEKGRCDLLPLGVIGYYTSDLILERINNFINSGEKSELWGAIEYFIDRSYFPGDTKSQSEKLYSAFLDVSHHYEEGAAKYGERNWEKGIPIHCYIDSAVRHHFKFLRGDTDERHDRAVIWNLLGAIYTMEEFPKLFDMNESVIKQFDNVERRA